VKLSRLIDRDNVRADSVYGADNYPTPEGTGDMDPYTVTLKRKRRTLAVPFYMGYGLRDSSPNGPDALTVLSALIMDGYAEDSSFEDWCAEFGYDIDSRKAHATYEACRENAGKLRKFLGEDYEEYKRAENDA
jgi:hypothetical protein